MGYCIGLTGSIASGKSTVAELFAELGVQIINADNISRELTAKDQIAYQQIVTHYGTEILNTDKTLNRSALRAIIFENPMERQWLEQLLHPLIRNRIKDSVKECTSSYCIVEIPLLVDKKNYPYINRILLVTAPLNKQISRVIARDQCSKEQALAILASQPDIELRKKNADDLLINDSDFSTLRDAVLQLHQKYLQYSSTGHSEDKIGKPL